jgi:sugar (pentulose or hexulose) kinase
MKLFISVVNLVRLPRAMSKILLVDFGASRVKTLLFDSVESAIVDNEECVSPSAKSWDSVENRFEIPIEEYWKALLETVGKIILRHPEKNIKNMWICSEMHGFVLAYLDGRAITPYISWKDQRANFDDIGGESTFEKLKSELQSFRSITGMNLKSGLPVLTLASGCRTGSIPELKVLSEGAGVRVLSLVDWLLFRGGESMPKANITLAAGLGLYDINRRALSQEILNSKHLYSLNIMGLDIQCDISKPLGTIRIFDSAISVFGGIGDFQAALAGSGLFDKYDAVLNLGTGSQAAVKAFNTSEPNENEVRIMSDGSFLNVITHIPCGRALNVYASFINAVSAEGGGQDFFWKSWSLLSSEAILKSKLDSNLALFESAWGRRANAESNGAIGLDEGSSSVSDVLAGIAKSWLLQYLNALNKLDPFIMAKKVIVCGGVGQKSKFAIPVLEKLMPQRRFHLATTQAGEETFDGLLRLAISNQ